MFTYRIQSKHHISLSRKKTTEIVEVDLDEFRKEIGLHIRNDRTLNKEIESNVRNVLKKIRKDSKANPNTLDTSYETDDSFLSAHSTCDDATADALDASQRKTLALNVMKVYRENIPQLDNEDRLYYVRATLVNLNIKQELWSDDRSTPNVHRD